MICNLQEQKAGRKTSVKWGKIVKSAKSAATGPLELNALMPSGNIPIVSGAGDTVSKRDPSRAP